MENCLENCLESPDGLSPLSPPPCSPAEIVLVGADGVPIAPIVMPSQPDALQFLSCFESALYPRAQLDPPLWPQRGRAVKSLPKLSRKSSTNVSKKVLREIPLSKSLLEHGTLGHTDDAPEFTGAYGEEGGAERGSTRDPGLRFSHSAR